MATICLLKGKATARLHPVSTVNSDRICQIISLIDCYPEQSNKFDGATLHLTWKQQVGGGRPSIKGNCHPLCAAQSHLELTSGVHFLGIQISYSSR